MDAPTFTNDPAAFFACSSAAAHRLDRSKAERLQLAAIQERFAALRGKVKALTVLSHELGIAEIGSLDEALPLFFPHALYKSYPEAWLTEGRFAELTGCLQAFTACDLSPARARHYDSIDGWLAGLDELTDLRLRHSSGTTGKLSFLPRGLDDLAAGGQIHQLDLAQWTDDESGGRFVWDFPVVHMSMRGGRSSMARSLEHMESLMVPPGEMHTLGTQKSSVDVEYYLTRRAAAVRGGGTAPEPSPYVAAQLEQMGANPPLQHSFRRIHDLLVGPLAGQFVLIIGTTVVLWQLARAGLEWGGSGVLRQGGGRMVMGGGLKGTNLPADWQATLDAYFGAEAINQAYGMTEVMGALSMCQAGRYHCPPWTVPYMLDAETGRPLPREGEQSGRGAFFDISARSHWGGVVTADHITMSWRPCACGRTTPHIAADIQRSIDGSDDGLTAAAPRAAIDAVIASCTAVYA